MPGISWICIREIDFDTYNICGESGYPDRDHRIHLILKLSRMPITCTNVQCLPDRIDFSRRMHIYRPAKKRVLVTFLSEPLGIIPAQFLGLFRGKILFFIGVQVFFHLSYNVLGIMIILHLKVCRDFSHLVGMTANRAQFPFLEPIHVRKRPASRTPEDMVHKYEVMRASHIKIYW